jgi:hypothetical protein
MKAEKVRALWEKVWDMALKSVEGSDWYGVELVYNWNDAQGAIDKAIIEDEKEQGGI